MEKQIIEILKEHIEELKDVEIKADTALISSGYLESFDIIGIIVSLEEAFERSFRWRTWNWRISTR